MVKVPSPDLALEDADWPKRTPDTPEALGLGSHYHGPGRFKLDPDAPSATPREAGRRLERRSAAIAKLSEDVDALRARVAALSDRSGSA